MVIYLSCPISSRAGSFANTNVEIAEFTAARLVAEWGPRFWIVNPSMYQLASKQGTGLINRHARLADRPKAQGGWGSPIDIEKLQQDKKQRPTGGDYMRMWTRVLVEDGSKNFGDRFSAFYFLGPSDVHRFFQQSSNSSLTASVEAYFARKLAVDQDFRNAFSPPFKDANGDPIPTGERTEREWLRLRAEFVRFYTVRASAYFSLGSHDEWNIWYELNRIRRDSPIFGPAATISGFYDGIPVVPGAAEQSISRGYALPVETTAAALPVAEPKHRSPAIDDLESSRSLRDITPRRPK